MSAPATEPLGVLARAQDSFGIAPNAPANEWPFNLLSQQAVRFAGGRIGRASDPVPTAADPAEQALCDKISQEAAAVVNKLKVRPKSAVIDPFRLPAVTGEPVATEITPDLIRERFGGTLHPWAKIEITPLADIEGEDLSFKCFSEMPTKRNAHNAAWSKVAKWFADHPDLPGEGWVVEVEGLGVYGTQAVRLVVGLTAAGSVVGVAAVGLVSGLTWTMTPAQMYPSLREFELADFTQWLDGGSGRATARVILRTFPPAGLDQWEEGTWAERTRLAAARLKSHLRAAYWRSEFHKLTPEREAVLSPAWEGVQRATTCGRWNSHWHETPQLYAKVTNRCGEFERGSDSHHLYGPDEVRRCAEWLAAHDENWLKARYADLRATDYAQFMGEADLQAVAAAYRQTKEFYAHAAANGLAVVTEITARTDAEIAAETANPNPAEPPKKVKGKKDGCGVDNDQLAPLLPCMEVYGAVGRGEWPHNDLSPRIVRFACGRIAREGEEIAHKHPKGEVDRCRAVAAEAERLLAGCVPPHDSGGPYLAFFAAANTGDDVPQAFTEGYVRGELFNGTVSPDVAISVGPLTPAAVWDDGSAEVAEFVRWFTAEPGLHGHAFVSIGLDEDHGGASHPRLAVAFTDRGSVVGVCGYVIWA